MNTKSFTGGVHPTEGNDKQLTRGKKMITYIPETVCISSKQGLGPDAEFIVKEGDTVKQGQLIAKSNHFLTADVHSSVDGTVVSIGKDGCTIKVAACTLPDTEASYYKEWVEVSADKEKIIDLLKEGGLVGMGGAGFPASAKYATKDPITHVLINAAECEPFLTCDEHLILEQGMAVINGARALKKAAGAPHAVICIEDNKPEVIAHLEGLLKGHEKEIELLVLPTKYPQGGEKQLIAMAIGKEIPSGKLPANVGAIVSNVHTAKAAADMVFAGIPSISRCITVTGDVTDPENYLVPIGTNIGELVEKSKGMAVGTNKVILGGPMTGRCLGTNMTAEDVKALNVCVSKVSGGLIVLKGYFPEESACIRCGGCGLACPIGLNPFKIDSAVRRGDIALCQALDAAECIACGCCSFTCPAKRELTTNVVKARDLVKAKLREEASKNGK